MCRQDEKCKYKASASGATDSGYVDVPHGDESKLQEAVATIGPVSIAIDASHTSFQLYKSGQSLYTGEWCFGKLLTSCC